MTAVFVLIGCAGLTAVESALTAKYYETVCTDKGYVTQEAKMDVDLPVAAKYNSDVDENVEEYDVDVEWAWIDYCHNALALKYVERVGGDEQCVIFMFEQQDFPVVLTEDYNTVQPIDMRAFPCEKLESELAVQINRGFTEWR
jgi:hypothetical protein